ncbi:hypothetical protein EV421DRAFT_1909355 [Armillaria borealis]|uniref:Uncharacterized protein n=1 Tax=Armillaria borealis TaxID=47425 RepID=A0AA39J1L2_9AGAR|nr:hypothetical protein EV421DRAFT_1909355 [Armillaria borealis]
MTRALAISVTCPAHHAHGNRQGANPDLYACVKEVGASWRLHFNINTGRIIRSSAPLDAQLLPVLTYDDSIQTMTLNSPISFTLDRYSILNSKELFLYSAVQCANIDLLFQAPLSTSKGIWKHRSTSSTKTIITVTSATRADAHVVRELTFKEGKPGILPELQRSRWRAPEGFVPLGIIAFSK